MLNFKPMMARIVISVVFIPLACSAHSLSWVSETTLTIAEKLHKLVAKLYNWTHIKFPLEVKKK